MGERISALKGGNGEMGQWLQRLIAGSSGEVSDATIQGYLRAASQIEEVWQQIDDEVDALTTQGVAPWNAYARKGYALAFVRACRLDIVFVQELLKAYASANAGTMKYLPRETYDQALAISEHIEPFLEEAIKASADAHYVPASFPFPLPFGPHIRSGSRQFPLTHLQGLIGAAHEMRDWVAGLLAKYELALNAAKMPIPQAVSTHLEQLKGLLQLGDFHLRTGLDMVGQVSQVTHELSEKTEGFLWEAMESFYKLSQLIANPAAQMRPARSVPDTVTHQQQSYTRHTPSGEANTTIPVSHVSPAPPTPDISILLNQVIAEAEQTQTTSAQQSPVASALLNQVIAEPEPAQNESVQSPSDVSALLNQVVAEQEAGQRTSTPPPAPEEPDMLNQVIAEPGVIQSTSAQSRLLEKEPPVEGRQQHLNKPASGGNLLDMLSDVCGEQEETDKS